MKSFYRTWRAGILATLTLAAAFAVPALLITYPVMMFLVAVFFGIMILATAWVLLLDFFS
jgi:hypothetical protein